MKDAGITEPLESSQDGADSVLAIMQATKEQFDAAVAESGDAGDIFQTN